MKKIYRYYSKPDILNRVTVVGERDGDNLYLSAARCSHLDIFCRKTGRSIAEGRLSKKLYCDVRNVSLEKKFSSNTFVMYAKLAILKIEEDCKLNYKRHIKR